jgi:TPP-dependent 2-oxoacid decarboxylase
MASVTGGYVRSVRMNKRNVTVTLPEQTIDALLRMYEDVASVNEKAMLSSGTATKSSIDYFIGKMIKASVSTYPILKYSMWGKPLNIPESVGSTAELDEMEAEFAY